MNGAEIDYEHEHRFAEHEHEHENRSDSSLMDNTHRQPWVFISVD